VARRLPNQPDIVDLSLLCSLSLCHCQGRTFDEFVAESDAHGWPSFRDEEVVWDNVRCLRDGESVSVDGTHLGEDSFGTMPLLVPSTALVDISGTRFPAS
jgi:hypothetical protein